MFQNKEEKSKCMLAKAINEYENYNNIRYKYYDNVEYYRRGWLTYTKICWSSPFFTLIDKRFEWLKEKK